MRLISLNEVGVEAGHKLPNKVHVAVGEVTEQNNA